MRYGILSLAILLPICSTGFSDETSKRQRLEFFEANIRPVLVKHCYECHAGDSKKVQGRLLLDSRQGLLKGGESGPAIVPSNPKESLLISAMKHNALEMPPKGKLPDSVIADFEKWISDGAIDPRDAPPAGDHAQATAWEVTYAARREWWS